MPHVDVDDLCFDVGEVRALRRPMGPPPSADGDVWSV
jgi:hypothetical protein